LKKCRVCGDRFVAFRTVDPVCGKMACRYEFAMRVAAKARSKREKDQAREDREKLKSMETLTQHKNKVKRTFQKWCRLRDRDEGCISCGTTRAGQYHGGHYRTTKAASQLMFHPMNCWKQCAQCNNHDSGNVVEYRINLVNRIGLAAVEWLESNHDTHRWTHEELDAIDEWYKSLIRDIERDAV
jgi:hypothetical protein